MRITFDLDLQPLEGWFNGAEEKVRHGVERGVTQSALEVMRLSQQIVPVGGPPTSPYDVAPGTLRASGTVLLPEWRGSECVVVLGYGGAAEAYAWRQHEDLSYRHKAGQQAKYLEQPFDEQQENTFRRIVAAVREALGVG